jgi:hypothetical protein
MESASIDQKGRIAQSRKKDRPEMVLATIWHTRRTRILCSLTSPRKFGTGKCVFPQNKLRADVSK